MAKDFAISNSILIVTLASVYLFDFRPNFLYMFGVNFVILSTFLYSESFISILKFINKQRSLMMYKCYWFFDLFISFEKFIGIYIFLQLFLNKFFETNSELS